PSPLLPSPIHSPLHHPHPHSFPTRRSSDLDHQDALERPGRVLAPARPLWPVAQARQRSALPEGGNLCRAAGADALAGSPHAVIADRKSTRLNSSHSQISYAVFCLKKKKKKA